MFHTRLGSLYEADCLDVLPTFKSKSVDTVFADPPFNLRKDYGARAPDHLAEDEYLSWCRGWLTECVRVLRPGGAIFVYNLPKWNISLGAYLNELQLRFRHWIAIEQKGAVPDCWQIISRSLLAALLHEGKAEAI